MLFLLLMLAPADASPQQTQTLPAQPDLVVIADRLLLQKKLADCIARKCPPDEDAAAALALAGQQFVDGDYRKARTTLNGSLARTRGQTRQYPVPVSKLWQAQSRVDSHLGEFTFAQSESAKAYSVLQSNLPDNDPRALNAGLELAGLYTHQNRWNEARNLYLDLIQRSEQAKHPDIAALARIKLAKFIAFTSPGKVGKSEQREIGTVLAPLIGSTDPDYKVYDFPARLFLARLAEETGEKGAVDALYRQLPADHKIPPVLLSSKPIKANKLIESTKGQAFQCMQSGSPLGCSRPDTLVSTQNLERQWIDVGFSIQPDGSVTDVDVVRRSPTYAGDWADRVLTSVRSRRYAAGSNTATLPSIQRLERYTLTAKRVAPTGSRIAVPEADEVFEMVDLTRLSDNPAG